MKRTQTLFALSIVAGLLSAAAGFLSYAAGVATTAAPKITEVQIEKRDVIVFVDVPAGLRKVTLEGRSRLGAGAWVPRAVQRVDGTAQTVSFRLEMSPQLEMLRARGDETEPLPASFYRGTNSFAGQAVGDGSFAGPNAGPAPPTPTRAIEDAGGGGAKAGRDVVESDIWKVEGNTVYFFNQYRGLQVIDVTKPDEPVLRGTLPMAAAGEDMYLLESGHVVLLARDACNYSPDGAQSQVLVVQVADGVPAMVASVPVSGMINESRLVGTALYVASQNYRRTFSPNPKGGAPEELWEWGTTISSFDLSDAAKPAAKSSLWVPGWNNAVTATDRFLFVSAVDPASSYTRSLVQVIDISAPDGTMSATAKIRPYGQVNDKFKINLSGDTLAIISEKFEPELRLPDPNTPRWLTKVETFSLANPANPESLGSLELGRGERLFATRFDGDRVYVVTFLRIDPLWVVDLSDPRKPTISGELEIPGWSTYIQPLGDRLVTVGIDDTNGWRVAVQLFDVKDPTKPALLSKVPLGENHSWSEANYDEKAFTVLPEAGLILLPYNGYSERGYSQRVQLIDLGKDDLKARGTIDHRFQPRRATLHQDRIFSISGQEFLTVNATDRDQPKVSATLELAWSADRVFAVGDHLVQLATEWNGVSEVSVTVVSASDPNTLLARQTLKEPGLLGAAVRDSKLYVLQGKPTEYVWPTVKEGEKPPEGPAKINDATLTLTVFDLSNLPALAQIGQATAAFKEETYWSNVTPLWVKPELLVWTGGNNYWGPWLWDGGFARGGIAVADVAFRGGIWWPWGGGSGQLLAFDVANAAAPKFASRATVTDTGNWWNFSEAHTEGGLVFMSHQSSEFLPNVLPAGQEPPKPVVTIDPNTGEKIITEIPVGTWVQKYFLDVVDYADAANPTLRKPVNIPGMLRGVGQGGALIYTVGNHWDPKNFTTDWTEWLDASAYDGVAAHLVDSMQLPKEWPHPLIVRSGKVFLGRPAPDNNGQAQLETWSLNDAGKLARLSSVPVGSPIEEMELFDNILATRRGTVLDLFNVSNPAAPAPAGKASQEGCVYFSLINASYSSKTGLWIPLNAYGLLHLRVTSP